MKSDFSPSFFTAFLGRDAITRSREWQMRVVNNVTFSLSFTTNDRLTAVLRNKYFLLCSELWQGQGIPLSYVTSLTVM